MDLFREQGVIDELGLGTIRDSLSDILFPGTSTIQTRAKYFLLIPWILRDIESRGRLDRFQTELEELEIHFIKVLRSKPNGGGIIGATLQNANPKRKPSSIYWNGLRTYDILNFKGSINDYINYLRYHSKQQQKQKKQIVEKEGNVPGDDTDANHMYQQHLWCQLPKPPADWNTSMTIDLSEHEAQFLKERIILSNSDSLWSFALKYIPDEAKSFSGIADFLSVEEFPAKLKELVRLSVDFNTIMQGALIRYNLLIQLSRENGRAEELQPVWKNYWNEIKSFDWNCWDTNRLWQYCPFTKYLTKNFVESWIEIVKSETFNETKAEELLKSRELKLKGVRRARLYDKAVAQKQKTFTGISITKEGGVSYLNYRWNTVKTFLNDIQNGLANNVTAK